MDGKRDAISEEVHIVGVVIFSFEAIRSEGEVDAIGSYEATKFEDGVVSGDAFFICVVRVTDSYCFYVSRICNSY